MKTVATRPNKAVSRETLNLRIHACDRDLIDRAAALSGKARGDFILGAARRAAEEALLGQSLFLVGRSTYAKSVAMLNAPAKPNVRLERTMKATPPWHRP